MKIGTNCQRQNVGHNDSSFYNYKVSKSTALDVLERCIQGLPKVFKYPLLSQERVKLRTSNLAGTFTGSIRTKRPLKILEKGERGRNQGLPNVLKYPLLSQERVNLRTSNLAGTLTESIRTKVH